MIEAKDRLYGADVLGVAPGEAITVSLQNYTLGAVSADSQTAAPEQAMVKQAAQALADHIDHQVFKALAVDFGYEGSFVKQQPLYTRSFAYMGGPVWPQQTIFDPASLVEPEHVQPRPPVRVPVPVEQLRVETHTAREITLEG